MAFSDASHNYLFPGIDALDFSQNCTLYGHFMATMMLPDPWADNTFLYGSISAGIDAYAAALPGGKEFNWTYVFAESPNATLTDVYAEISHWLGYELYYSYNDTTQLFTPDPALWKKIVTTADECPAEYCKAVGYTGNQDLTGIGVVLSYYIEAVLATLYLFAFTVWNVNSHYRKRYQPVKRKTSRPEMVHTKSGRLIAKLSIGRRTLDGFRGSLDMFLSSTMLISVAMLLAAVFVTASRQLKKRTIGKIGEIGATGSDIYDISLSLLAATFSVFPVMLLYALMRHPGRDNEGTHRKWVRRAVLLLIWALGVVEVYLAPRGELDYKFRHEKIQQFDCDHRGGPRYWQGLKASQFLVVGVPLLWIVLTTFVVTGFRVPGLVERPWMQRWRSVWRLTVAWVNMLTMWGVLGYFTVLRHNIIATADGADKSEDKWGFGQILALATWVPVVTEFWYIFFFGIEDGMTGHLPPDFHVARNDGTADTDKIPLMGMDQLNGAPDTASIHTHHHQRNDSTPSLAPTPEPSFPSAAKAGMYTTTTTGLGATEPWLQSPPPPFSTSPQPAHEFTYSSGYAQVGQGLPPQPQSHPQQQQQYQQNQQQRQQSPPGYFGQNHQQSPEIQGQPQQRAWDEWYRTGW